MTTHESTRESLFYPQKYTCARLHHTSWCSGFLTEKGWSSDFPPLPSAFSPKRVMAFMLRSHNGVHCCGTVGDSHSHSQLSTAKCTFTGNSFQNCAAKVRIFYNITSNLAEKRSLDFPIVTFAITNNKEKVTYRKNTNFAFGK